MKDMDLNKMQTIIRDMPQYSELLTRYSLHMYLIDKALGTFNAKDLKTEADTEQLVATGVDSSSNIASASDIFNAAFRELTNPKISPTDKLRMAILVFASFYLNDTNYQKVRSCLADPSDLRVLDNLAYLGLRNEANQGAAKQRMTDDEKKFFKNVSKNSKFDLSRFMPRLYSLLEQVYSNKLNTNQYSLAAHPGGAVPAKKLLSTDLLSFKTNDIAKGSSAATKDKLIVFYVGGMTYSEVRVVKDLEGSAGWKETMGVCGGTTMISPEDFLEEMLRIGGGGQRRGIDQSDISARLRNN